MIAAAAVTKTYIETERLILRPFCLEHSVKVCC